MSIYDFTVKDREGNVVERYAPTDVPEKIEGAIKKLI